MTTIEGSEPAALAKAWLEVDPDDDTRAETRRLLEAGGSQLDERFRGSLSFGTAGLRGPLAAGPNAMNRVLVRLAAAAIAEAIEGESDPHVVIGFDGRHGSESFALDTARVLLARGARCTLLPGPLPTPVLAFTTRQLEASAGVMVTASHNPRTDNGYKVYWRGGALLTSPLDEYLVERMRALPLLGDDDLVPATDARLAPGPEQLVADYVAAMATSVDPTTSRSIRTVHTALHGVGSEVIASAFAAAGFVPPIPVDSQAAPDPDFPTAAFPNPEEPGALDLLLALGDETGVDLALANDPDADRLAVAVPTDDGWRNLSGDELGCLLADHLLRRESDDRRPSLVATTVVSSRLLASIADHYGAAYAETLTGFKWIMDAARQRPDHRFVCGYEEALGYAVNEAVPDKDGVSAALVIAELASELKDQGQTLLDRLDEIHARHGVHVAGQRALRFETGESADTGRERAMAALRAHPPSHVGDAGVQRVIDLALGDEALPPTDGLVLELDDARLVVRPSGTEPKLKIYGEVRADDGDVTSARADARVRLRTLLDAAVARAAAFDVDSLTEASSRRSEAAEAFATPVTGRDRATDLQLIVRCLDLTTLEGDDTRARVRALCAQARRPDAANASIGPVAAVCVYPALAGVVAELLAGTSVHTASVAGAFPSGLSSTEVRLADIEDAVHRGADEVDIVIDRSALLEGRTADVVDYLTAARAAAGDAHLKVILEVGDLDERHIQLAARLAMETGADFIKTSTGKTPRSASPEAVWTMAEAIKAYAEATGRRVGLKVAGGVRTADDALGYVNIIRRVLGPDWLTPDLMRFGASSLLNAVLADLDTPSRG